MTRLAYRSLAAALLMTLAAGGAACRQPVGPSSPVTFTLAPTTSLRIEQARLTFVRVVSDDRCPLNAICVSQGDAVVEVNLAVAASESTFELALNDQTRNSIAYKGIVVTLDDLQPYPFAGSPTDPADYRASFELASQ
jgi:hypothetical protein